MRRCFSFKTNLMARYDGQGDSKSSSSKSSWFGLTASTEVSNTPIFEMNSGYGDKITVSQTQSAIVKGKQGKFYNIDVGSNLKGTLQSISVTNLGITMALDIGHFGFSGGLSLSGYHQTFGFSFHGGFGFTSSSGYSNGQADNTLNIKMNPGLYTFGAAAATGLIITQPELSPAIIPFFLIKFRK